MDWVVVGMFVVPLVAILSIVWMTMPNTYRPRRGDDGDDGGLSLGAVALDGSPRRAGSNTDGDGGDD